MTKNKNNNNYVPYIPPPTLKKKKKREPSSRVDPSFAINLPKRKKSVRTKSLISSSINHYFKLADKPSEKRYSLKRGDI
jgi:hypothetical protein